MVHTNNFEDILDKLPDLTCITLPTYKETCLKIEYYENEDSEIVYGGSHPIMPFGNSDVFHADISAWRRLSAFNENCKPIYEVTFDVTDSNFTFKAGDTIGVVAQNIESEVNSILDHLELNTKADKTYKLHITGNSKGSKIPPYVPCKSTLRQLLTYCLDIRGIMKKLFLLALSRHTKDENERRVLEYLCSKEGSEVYQTYIINKSICILDIFKIFKSCKPDIEVLIAYLPRLLPRPYSVVNTGLKDSRKISICFSVINLENQRKGLTTGFLEDMIVNKELDLDRSLQKLCIENNKKERYGKVPIYIRKNILGFSVPKNLEKPLILICNGTGVAPFISFLEEIELVKENSKIFGDIYLFFGCRNPNLDFIYEDELKGFLARGVLNKLFTTFSKGDTEVKYVQDAIMQNGEEVIQLIRNEASIYICGDVKHMAVQVKEILIKCFQKYDSKTQDEAKKMICDIEKLKRYHVDTWV